MKYIYIFYILPYNLPALYDSEDDNSEVGYPYLARFETDIHTRTDSKNFEKLSRSKSVEKRQRVMYFENCLDRRCSRHPPNLWKWAHQLIFGFLLIVACILHAVSHIEYIEILYIFNIYAI